MNLSDRSLIILAGGRSSRLGQDKVFLEIAGSPPILRILDAMPNLDVVISVREVAPFQTILEANAWKFVPDESDFVVTVTREDRTAQIVPDPEPNLGPVVGLASALKYTEGQTVLVMAGDLPFVTSAFCERIFEILDANPDLDAVVPMAGGREQPLCAAYRNNVRKQVEALLEASLHGEEPLSMMRLLSRIKFRRVEADVFADVDDLEIITRGIDTAKDVLWAEEIGRS